LAAGCWFAAFALPLGWIDAVMRRLPDALTWPAYAGTLALLLVAAAVSGNWAQFGVAAAGGAAAGGGFALITLVSPRAAGLGDAKLTLGLGTLLAWGGWTVLLAGVAAGFALAACYGLGLLAARRATLSAQVPFGPFLIAGTFALVLLTGR
jgi:leader peptidase (prepilin peptidase)/N-methyltransferase